MSKHRFKYLDLENIQGGWVQLFNELPEWITELRKPEYEPLDKEVEAALIEAGNMDKVVKANLRFVTNIARHYIVDELHVWELISAGNEGLVEAFHKFDATKGVKFITYAVNIIRAKMIEAMRQANAINLSVKAIQLLTDYSHYGDIDEMIEALPHRYPQSPSALLKKLDEYLNIKWVASLDDQIGDDTKRSDLVKSSSNTDFSDEIRSIIEESTLDPIEAKVIVLMFGLGDELPMSSRDIGELLGKSKDTIRRIKLKAFNKLKDIDRLKDIMDFINEEQSEVTWAQPKGYSSSE